MPKSRRPDTAAATISPERAARLYRLVTLLGRGPQTRAKLTRALRFNVRGFYRDLEILRDAGIAVTLANGQYALAARMVEALDRLPFPDPRLSLGEARQLSRGRSKAHKKLRHQLARIVKR
jgi:predicted DNA-binding transcriptional regulator YafY